MTQVFSSTQDAISHNIYSNVFAAKLTPVAYNINKLSIVCVVEDEKVSIEDLSERIESLHDYVQSVDVASFNKI